MPFSPAENIGKIPYFADVILPAAKVLRALVLSDVGRVMILTGFSYSFEHSPQIRQVTGTNGSAKASNLKEKFADFGPF